METIRELLDFCAQNYPTIPALKWPTKDGVSEITYRSFAANVGSLRSALNSEGFCQDHIALVGYSSEPWIEAFFAITSGKNTAVLIDPLLPDEEIADLIARSDSAAIFLDPTKQDLAKKLTAACPKLHKTYNLSTLSSLRAEAPKATSVAGPAPADLAMIIFTSGTTGKSKGVMLTQKNLLSNVEAVEYDSFPGRVVLSVLPAHHAYCLVMDYLKCLSLGSTVCINDSFLHMVKNMQLFKPEVMLMVPMMIETIYKKLGSAAKLLPKKVVANKVFGGRLTTVFSGGAHLDPFYIDKFKEFGVNIYQGYGMSECSPVISTNTPTANKPGSVGKLLPNAQVRFENGEILVKSTSLMKGYYNMPAETAEALENGWLHTGDKGYLDDDGYLFINGRVKNLIILSNGENVSPEEIENKLALYPLVEEVVVTGDGTGLTARIYPDKELASKKKMDPEKLEKELQKVLDDYNKQVPTYRRIAHLIIRNNPFRRNTTRKILRQYAAEDIPAQTLVS
ncbi:AMP-binding protein [Butyrivibrio sp. AE3009]|uniref:AMP-binding protein n=1 Tax=Butyrivibrio sp. AE3009 TaxID=1280666 RepID=UPI0003B54256|nr:AMP-binding protein [Butyrivibrio sp. AE3009]